MSHAALVWALEKAQTKGAGQSAVLMFVAFRADNDGFGRWPADKIGAQIGIKGRQVRTHLDALADAGLLQKVRREVRGDGTFGAWLYWVPFKVRPATLPKGKPWPDAAERDLSGITIGATEDCPQAVDEPVDRASAIRAKAHMVQRQKPAAQEDKYSKTTETNSCSVDPSTRHLRSAS